MVHFFSYALFQIYELLNLFLIMIQFRRISLSSRKYHVIRAPIIYRKYQDLHLGKSRKGVYFASLDDQCYLQVWRLKDASAKMEWVSIHLKRVPACQKYGQRSWTFQGINYHDDADKSVHPNNKTSNEALEEENLEWNSDDDDLGMHGHRPMSIVGFHPYKEVIFLCEWPTRVIVDYHLNGLKVQYLSSLPPLEGHGPESINLSFPYTPCRM